MRPVLRRQEALDKPERLHGAHLGDALKHGGPRVRRGALVLCGGYVAEGKARVIMGRTDEAVEVDFVVGHQSLKFGACEAFTHRRCLERF